MAEDTPTPEPAAAGTETAAAVLRPGQVVWADVEGDVARLPSGAPLWVAPREPDGFDGWRPVRVVDPARFRVEVLPVDGRPPAAVEAPDPSTLWPLETPDPSQPRRPPPFPVGYGGGLVTRRTALVVACICVLVGLLAGAALALALG